MCENARLLLHSEVKGGVPGLWGNGHPRAKAAGAKEEVEPSIRPAVEGIILRHEQGRLRQMKDVRREQLLWVDVEIALKHPRPSTRAREAEHGFHELDVLLCIIL